MSKSKISPEEKLYSIHRIKSDKESITHVADRLGVALTSVQQWITNYNSSGEEAFKQTRYKHYPKKLKEQAVLDYLTEKGSQTDICKKYGIRSKSKLQLWIKMYNSHDKLPSSGTGGTVIMTKGRKTTFEERVEIAAYCITHDHNYAETAEKFGVSYQQARNYTVKYENKGIDGLQDNRGKRKDDATMTEVERLRAENRLLKAQKEHAESPDKGYRRIRDDLERYYDTKVNDKRVLRICRKKDIKSTIKYLNEGCTRNAANPQYIAENILNREFNAEAPNEKWLTDVTEFKYYIDNIKHKIYLSAILDLYDRRIVSYVIGDSNNNPLVFETLDKALASTPDAHPLFHSDRGFQYTNRTFHAKLEDAGMKQSMSRVAKCIDNGPMEGFWGKLKRERYYGNRFTDKAELITMIENYIEYYNNKRLQRNLGVLTPKEKHQSYSQAA